MFERQPTSVRLFSQVVAPPDVERRPVRKAESKLNKTTAELYDKAKQAGRQEGIQQGFAEGFHRGMTDAEARVEELYGEAIQEFRGALIGFVARSQQAIDDWKVEAEQRVAGIVIDIARRALAEELSISREAVLAIVREGLREVVHGGDVVVRINPIDAGTLLGRKDEILAACSNIRGIEVTSDLSIECGCRIETSGGVVDAEIETFLGRIEEAAA